tara:strand:+ start:1269 stop:1937 length:669 start_codon:yes stop_codon:yes gene_type:complete
MMQFLFSSIGKKIQVAISGIFLCIFLVFHLLNNITLFFGPAVFNAMVHFLESIKPMIRIMEFGLLFILIMHIGNAIKLTIENKAANPINYKQSQSNDVSSLNSRTMLISGTIILLFIILHLSYIWLSYQTHNPNNHSETYYDILLRNKIGFLGHKWTALFYVIAISIIAFHLRHGFQSALKTLGFLPNSKNNFLYKIAFIFWGIIPFGFIVIVLSIQFGIIN